MFNSFDNTWKYNWRLFYSMINYRPSLAICIEPCIISFIIFPFYLNSDSHPILWRLLISKSASCAYISCEIYIMFIIKIIWWNLKSFYLLELYTLYRLSQSLLYQIFNSLWIFFKQILLFVIFINWINNKTKCINWYFKLYWSLQCGDDLNSL